MDTAGPFGHRPSYVDLLVAQRQGHLRAGIQLVAGPALEPGSGTVGDHEAVRTNADHRRVKQIGMADETGHEAGSRAFVDRLGEPTWMILPPSMTAMRSDIVIASP